MVDTADPAAIAALSEGGDANEAPLLAERERTEFIANVPTGGQKARSGRLAIKIALGAVGGVVLLVVGVLVYAFFVGITSGRSRSETPAAEDNPTENRIGQLEAENRSLKGANGALRSQRALGETPDGDLISVESAGEEAGEAGTPDTPEEPIGSTDNPVRVEPTATPMPAPPRPTPRPAPAPRPAVRAPQPAPPPDPEAVWSAIQTSSIAFAPIQETADRPPTDTPVRLEATAEIAPERSPEEVAIASGVPLNEISPPAPAAPPAPELQVLPGTIVGGEQVLPATWNGATESAGGVAAIRLDEPLTDAAGAEVLPADAMLLTEIVAVTENGWVTQRAIAARWTDAESGEMRQVPLPEGALSIRGKKGEPLIAEITNDSQRAERRRGRRRALLGAVASVGEELTRDETSSSTTSSGLGGFSSSSTISSGDRNVFGAVLEGAGETLLEDSGRRRDRRDREPIYTVPAKTSIEVVVEAPFSLAGAEQVATSP